MSIFVKDSNLGPHEEEEVEEEEEEGGGGVVTAVAIFKAAPSTAVTKKRGVFCSSSCFSAVPGRYCGCMKKREGK